MANKTLKISDVSPCAGQQHVRLESPASSWHWGAWRPQPCKGTILPNADDILPSANPLQMTRWWPPRAPCRWHMIPLQLTSCRDSPHLLHSLLQKSFPAEDTRVFPAEADFGPLAIFETRSLSTSLKKCPPGPKVYWIYWCFQPTTASTALLEHCIASF